MLAHKFLYSWWLELRAELNCEREQGIEHAGENDLLVSGDLRPTELQIQL